MLILMSPSRDQSMNILRLSLLVPILSFPLFAAEPLGIGQEKVIPIMYPKFSLTGDYSMARKFIGLADSKLRENLDNEFGSALSFEAGLYKYFNAGALFSFNMPTNITKSLPFHLRLSLFAKPLIPLGERVSFFSRVGGGISSIICHPSLNYKLAAKGSEAIRAEIERVYDEQSYDAFGFGGNAFASIGIEYFPFSRVGLALEGGIRAEIVSAKKNPPPPRMPPKQATPNWLSYFVYGFPVSLTLQIIL